jgi:hypothetical protein
MIRSTLTLTPDRADATADDVATVAAKMKQWPMGREMLYTHNACNVEVWPGTAHSQV